MTDIERSKHAPPPTPKTDGPPPPNEKPPSSNDTSLWNTARAQGAAATLDGCLRHTTGQLSEECNEKPTEVSSGQLTRYIRESLHGEEKPGVDCGADDGNPLAK